MILKKIFFIPKTTFFSFIFLTWCSLSTLSSVIICIHITTWHFKPRKWPAYSKIDEMDFFIACEKNLPSWDETFRSKKVHMFQTEKPIRNISKLTKIIVSSEGSLLSIKNSKILQELIFEIASKPKSTMDLGSSVE